MRVLAVNSGIAAFCSATLLGLTAGGCSSSAGASSAAGGAGAARPSATVAAGGAVIATSRATPPSLAAKLLTPTDLPAGWARDTASNDPLLQTGCPLLNTTAWNADLTGHGEADLNAGMTGPFLVETIATGDAAHVTTAWNKLVGGLPDCTTYTHGGANGSSTFSIARSTLPAYGDGSYSFTLKIKISSGVSAAGYIVAARNGGSVVVVYMVGIAPLDKAFVESTIGKAVAKGRT